MDFGLLSGIIGVPAIIATTEAVKRGERSNAKASYRGNKCSMHVSLPKPSVFSVHFDAAPIVLAQGKLWVANPDTGLLTDATARNMLREAHAFAGYYRSHPVHQDEWKAAGHRGEGLVSTIYDDPPMLNWIYVDKETHALRYGTKAESEGHILGPWDATPQEHRVTFEGWEGFLAVEEESHGGPWALYFDVDDDGLRGGNRLGSLPESQRPRMLEVVLDRREMRVTRTAAEEMREDRGHRLREAEEKERKRREERENFRVDKFGEKVGDRDKLNEELAAERVDEEIDE